MLDDGLESQHCHSALAQSFNRAYPSQIKAQDTAVDSQENVLHVAPKQPITTYPSGIVFYIVTWTFIDVSDRSALESGYTPSAPARRDDSPTQGCARLGPRTRHPRQHQRG